MKIGIGVTTTFARNETAQIAIQNIAKYSVGCKMAVVKDVPGIAVAKNKCLALLDDCEHIFLFDDDTYAKVEGWYLPYIYSGINHLSFTFSHLHNGMTNGNRKFEGEYMDCSRFQNPCGCMLYLTKRCLDTVGGFDERFIGWGYEHADYSRRIYNAGLTPYPFMDVKNSLDLLHSMDYYREVQSSVEPIQRAGFIKHNRPLYEQGVNSREYCKYK